GAPQNLTVTGNTFAGTVSYGIAGTEGMTLAALYGNTFATTVEGIGLGAGVSLAGNALNRDGISMLLGAQTLTLGNGYALKDYRDATVYVTAATSIQDAIDGATALDTVLVGPGSYAEPLTIAEDVTLISHAGAGSTTISGAAPTGETIRFTANNVTLGGAGAGFTIDNGNAADGRAIAPAGTSGAAIIGNTIVNAFRGVQGDFYGRPTNLTITGNTFAGTVSYGIAGTEGMSIASISGNVFNTTVEGIGLGAGVSLAGNELDRAGIFSLLGAQTLTLGNGYALKDYRDATVYVNQSTSIQSAINGSENGDTILVGAGTYAEPLTIAKDVTLISHAGAGATTIAAASADPNGPYAVRFAANGVTLGGADAGFTISNLNAANGRAIAPAGTNGAAIIGNTIVNAFRGVQGDFYGRPTNLTITGNTFSSTVSYGIAGTEDMTLAALGGNTFATTVEGIGLGAGVSLAGNELDHAGIFSLLDAQTLTLGNGYALKDYRDATVYVTAATSIQGALNAAAAGDTVQVGPGTYSEQLTIARPVTLLGPNATTAGSAAGRSAEAVLRLPGSAAIGSSLVSVAQDVNNVTIAGLTLEIPDTSLPNYHYLLTTSRANNLTVRNNRMYGGEIAIYVLTADSMNVFRNGMLIEGNFIDGGPNVNSSYNRGMYIQSTAGTIQDNVVVNTNIGIQYMPYGHPESGVIRRNTVAAALIGLYHNYQTLGAAPVSWEQNVVTLAPNDRTGARAGVDGAWTGPVTFRGIQVITFGSQGTGAAPAVSFSNNAVDATPLEGVAYNSTVREAVRFTTPYGAGTATLAGNSFRGWTASVNNQMAGTFALRGNWWGTTAAGTIAAGITTSGGGGVDINGYLGTGDDAAPATIGFQSDFAEVWVTALGAQAGSTGRVARGLELVRTGGVLRINAGSYSDGVVSVPTTSQNLTIDVPAGTSGFSLELAGTANNDLTLSGAGALDVAGNAGANTLTGNAGANVLTGGDGDDTLTGGDGDDTLRGGVGSDTLRGGAGNNTLDGGTGLDTVVYSGTYASYTVTFGATATVTGATGTDAVTGVERLQFADRLVTLTVGAPGGDSQTFSRAFSEYAVSIDGSDVVIDGPDAIDRVSGIELLTFSDRNVQVVGTAVGSEYTTIAQGVAAASPGDVVLVAPGSYSGTVTLNKAVIIRGANAGVAGDGVRGPESTLNGVLVVAANGITIDGMAFDGGAGAIRGEYAANAYDDLTIRNNRIQNTTDTPIRLGLGSGGGIGSDDWTITGNRIDTIVGNALTGMVLFNVDGLTVTGNVINHTRSASTGRRGINLDGVLNATVTGNRIDLGLVTPGDSTAASAAAPWVIQLSMSDRAVTDVAVTDNVVSGAYRGITSLSQRSMTTVTISGNTVANVMEGIVLNTGSTPPQAAGVTMGTVRVTGNTITATSLAVFARALHNGHPNGPVVFNDLSILENVVAQGTVLVGRAETFVPGGASSAGDGLVRLTGSSAVDGSSASDRLQVAGAGQMVFEAVGGADSLSGGAGGDTLVGGNGDDVLAGNAGDDTLDGGTGSNTLDGGSGTDTAVYAGTYASYTVAYGTAVTVAGAGANDTLTNVERLQFADLLVTLVVGGTGVQARTFSGNYADYTVGLDAAVVAVAGSGTIDRVTEVERLVFADRIVTLVGASVGSSYATITDGIAATGDGGLVLVAPGTYPEVVTINKPALTLQSIAGTATTTISGAAPTGETIRFAADGVTLGGVGAGFTIDNGNAADGRAIAPAGTSGAAIIGNTIV
ncbi:MAG: right-handed parallel beta-helix repeat-containing protein, partial [Chloroflexi bacterium]|nr:right-handed parallel beta-helix repeat-containing protein [Chloroflexota bacterium]